jgi:hypothetical protein
MIFEMFTNTTVNETASFPSTDDIYIRFLFHNNTATNASEPVAYPLFGQSEVEIPWSAFQGNISKFAIDGQANWCSACGNSTGSCAVEALNPGMSSNSSSSSSSSSSSGNSGLTNVQAGVIGAMVTLAVVLLAEGLILLLTGLRLRKKSHAPATPNGVKA